VGKWRRLRVCLGGFARTRRAELELSSSFCAAVGLTNLLGHVLLRKHTTRTITLSKGLNVWMSSWLPQQRLSEKLRGPPRRYRIPCFIPVRPLDKPVGGRLYREKWHISLFRSSLVRVIPKNECFYFLCDFHVFAFICCWHVWNSLIFMINLPVFNFVLCLFFSKVSSYTWHRTVYWAWSM